MLTVNKVVTPALILKCIDQTLTNPYSLVTDMNQKMGYVSNSQSGRQHLALSQLVGSIEEIPPYWLRPTHVGRTLLAESRSNPVALWKVLLALPSYRQYLEFELFDLLLSNQRRNPSLGTQVRRAIEDSFPAFQTRAEQLRQFITQSTTLTGSIVSHLARQDPLEPIALAALKDLAFAQGMHSGKSDLTRAAELAAVLAQAASIPLHIDAAWLRKDQFFTLLLLAAARQQEEGVIISLGQPTPLALVITELQRVGIDIRIEQRGAQQIAALVPPISLHVKDWSLRAYERKGLDLVQNIDEAHETFNTLEESIREIINTKMLVGIDGQPRGQVSFEEIAQTFSQHLMNGLGEFSGHGAAEEMQPISSAWTFGGSLPLASDQPRLRRSYRFLDEATKSQQRQTAPGTAVLLSPWLLGQQLAPESLMAIHPHLALLYLIVADTGAQAELLERREVQWNLEGKPLVLALDDRLRALGYEVWDEGYADREDVIHSYGQSLVEQGLRCGVLELGETGSVSLEAPSSYGYYEASELLVLANTGGSVR